jgi:hypothetical protein
MLVFAYYTLDNVASKLQPAGIHREPLAMDEKMRAGVPLPMTVSVEGDGKRLRIELEADPALLFDFAAAWKRESRKVLTAFKRFVITQAKGAKPAVRDRTGTLNPRVPVAIHARFKEICGIATPPITQADAIKKVLNRYINLSRNVRRTLYDDQHVPLRDHYGQRRKLTPTREELGNPAFDADPKEKMHFDAGPKCKAVIEQLIAEGGVSKSRFFAFVLSEATAEFEHHQQSQDK